MAHDEPETTQLWPCADTACRAVSLLSVVKPKRGDIAAFSVFEYLVLF